MNLSFKIRKGKKQNTIILDFNIGKEIRVRVSTGLKYVVHTRDYWDKRKGKLKIPNDIPNYEYINQRLSEIERQILKRIPKFLQNNIATNDLCRSIIVDVIDRKTSKKNKEPLKHPCLVLEYFDWYMDYYAKFVSSSTNKVLSSKTLRTYKNARNNFSKYLEFLGEKDIRFEQIDRDLYYDYINFSNEKGYTLNYIGSNIQKLKTIIKSAHENGVHKNTEYQKSYFKKMTEEINHPYLNEEELKAIHNLKINNEKMDRARDIFLLACNTALRVGDLKDFLTDPMIKTINGRNFMYKRQNKTGKEVYIPLKKMVKEILKKRDGKFPKKLHENTVNELMKSVAKQAKITEDYTLERTVGGVKIKETKPKYHFISMHSARRSFCTNAYNAGMPPHDIMIFSGHKSIKVFMNYIKCSTETKAYNASQHAFFDA